MTKEVFVFLDSTRLAPQSVQLSVIKSYAIKNNLKITFYGAEFSGYESKHLQLLEYAKSSKYSAFLMYSIYQFYEKSVGFDFSTLSTLAFTDKSFFFCLEDLSFHSLDEFQSLANDLKIAHVNHLHTFPILSSINQMIN